MLVEGEESLESTAIMNGLRLVTNWWVWWKVNKACCTIQRGGFGVCYRLYWRGANCEPRAVQYSTANPNLPPQLTPLGEGRSLL